MDVKGTILPIDSENVSEERFFFLWKMLTCCNQNFLIGTCASAEVEVLSDFEVARSSITNGICLRHGTFAPKSDLSLSKANPSLQENIFEETCLYPNVK